MRKLRANQMAVRYGPATHTPMSVASAMADRLRDEIEMAGWKVIDAGTSFRLEPAHAPDVVEEGRSRYGRSEAVPSRLAEPPTGLASVIVVATRASRRGRNGRSSSG